MTGSLDAFVYSLTKQRHSRKLKRNGHCFKKYISRQPTSLRSILSDMSKPSNEKQTGEFAFPFQKNRQVTVACRLLGFGATARFGVSV